ncbi:MAG: hypothetical protein ACR2KJ_10195 [Jatrophihabitans sp.]
MNFTPIEYLPSDPSCAVIVTGTVAVESPATAALGRSAAELLFRRLAGDIGPREQLVLATQLLPRASGDIAASRDRR